MAESQIKFNYGNEQLIKDAGSLSMFTALGTGDDVDDVVGISDTFKKISRVAGICRVDYDFVPGKSTDGTSAVNMAAKKLYTFVRHQNSGSRNYDSPDLMMYVYSVVSTYAFVAACERAYGVIKHYSCKNRYLGKALVDALGFDYDDLSTNLVDFRAYLNLTIGKLNALKVPSYWTVWLKQWYLNLSLFKDGDIDKSQIYFYRMMHMWKYNETGTYVGSLTPVALYLNSITLSQLKTLVETNINALVASEDINIMSGDILKAYGDNVINMPYIAEDFEVTPEWNRSILELIHNTCAYPVVESYTASTGFIIRQDTSNAIIFNPSINVTTVLDVDTSEEYYFKGNSDYLNFFRDDITPSDVVNASAMTILHNWDPTDQSVSLDSYGTELPTKVSFIGFVNYPSDAVVTGDYYRYNSSNSSASNMQEAFDQAQTEVNMTTMLSKFDWAPRVTLCGWKIWTDKPSTAPMIAELFDLYNFTVVSKEDLRKLHNLHVFAGFGLAE